uniref:Secreted protein n=1 Tax=Setaria viridis TaxID=4556 RepID=A0A4U6TLE4_SETVI|nr:hypothetical protein SEVIR_8G202650v2 [Setaria viridis]
MVSPSWRLMSVTQVLLCSASASFLCFPLDSIYRFGAMSFGLIPCPHAECQKLVLRPLPTTIVVQAANSRLSVSSHGTSVPIHVFCGESHSCHIQRSLKALANLCRFRTPNPPFSLGKQVLVQLTLHLPPVSVASPAQMKRFLILSSSSRTSVDAFRTVSRYSGCAERTVFVRQTRPAWERLRLCHPDSFCAVLSNIGWKSSFLRRLIARGRPRYRIGKRV